MKKPNSCIKDTKNNKLFIIIKLYEYDKGKNA